MKRKPQLISMMLVFILFIFSGSTVAAANTRHTDISNAAERIAGSNRVETAIEVSKKAYTGPVDTLFLAGYNGDADALSATFLAGQKDAPLLIADKQTISKELEQEIKRLGVKEIVILGGENAVSKTIEQQLRAKSYTTRRIKGNSRIDTAVNIATDYYQVNPVEEVFIVEYNSLVDALAIGPVAARDGIPVLITQKDQVPEEVQRFLETNKVEKATIIGGENAISQTGFEALMKHVKNVERVAGKNRILTSLTIADRYFESPNYTFLANGWQNADALIGGYFAGMENSPIVLIPKDGRSYEVYNYLAQTYVKAYVLGGESVVTKDFFNDLPIVLEGLLQPDLDYAELEAEVFRLTNIEREKNGLDAFILDDKLDAVASLKSQDMVDNNYYSHISPTYGSPFEMMKFYGINYSTAGENIAQGQVSADEVVEAWMNSTGHRENILNPAFSKIGIGAYAGNNRHLHWTQMFMN